MTAPSGLSGRTAVITGASRGIGLAIAGVLVGAGMDVWMLARNERLLADAAASLGRSARALTCDVLDAADVERAVDEIRRNGTVDVLVNNAGIFSMAPVDGTTEDAFEATIGVNLTAPFRFIRAILPAMRQRRSGHIVMIGSVADRTIFEGNAAYAASKFGARALMEVVRLETRGSGIRSTLVSPASTDTTLWDQFYSDEGGARSSRSEMLSPVAVADAVLWALTRPPGVNIDELRLSHS